MKTETKSNRLKAFAKSHQEKLPKEQGQAVDANVFFQKVEKKAYELYQKRGCQDGHDGEDWLEAQKIIEGEMILEK